MKQPADERVAKAPTKLKFSPWVMCGLVLAAGGTEGRSEENVTNAPRPAPAPLSSVAVFAGPDGKSFEPPAGSVVAVHVMPDSATFWKTLGAIKVIVKEAKTLVVFQGLARVDGRVVQPSDEEKKRLFMVDGEWFRMAAQPVAAEVGEAFRAAVFDGVKERKGVKLCGGFHADVLLRWGGGILTETDVLVCFGCSEVKLYGATGSLYGDLASEQAKALRELLAPFLAKQRETETK